MTATCTRSELISALQTHCPHLPRSQAEAVVRTLLEHMATALEQGRRIEIRDFGSFSLRHHSGRVRHVPSKGERVMVGDKYAVHFKPGKALKELPIPCEPCAPSEPSQRSESL